MVRKYRNHYVVQEDMVYLNIYGLKHEAVLKMDKADYEEACKMHWGLMEVGKKGNKKLIPYTVLHRNSIPMGRWLLQVDDSELRVEHHDRDNHNFLRSNLYVVGKYDSKQQVSIHDRNRICGVYEIKNPKGQCRGYKVQFRDVGTQKKKWKCFTVKQWVSLDEALAKAVQFRMEILEQNNGIAS